MLDGVHESAENTARVFFEDKYYRAEFQTLSVHVLKGVSCGEEKSSSGRCEEV
jgi:hypothetical protein